MIILVFFSSSKPFFCPNERKTATEFLLHWNRLNYWRSSCIALHATDLREFRSILVCSSQFRQMIFICTQFMHKDTIVNGKRIVNHNEMLLIILSEWNSQCTLCSLVHWAVYHSWKCWCADFILTVLFRIAVDSTTICSISWENVNMVLHSCMSAVSRRMTHIRFKRRVCFFMRVQFTEWNFRFEWSECVNNAPCIYLFEHSMG